MILWSYSSKSQYLHHERNRTINSYNAEPVTKKTNEYHKELTRYNKTKMQSHKEKTEDKKQENERTNILRVQSFCAG